MCKTELKDILDLIVQNFRAILGRMIFPGYLYSVLYSYGKWREGYGSKSKKYKQ
ncbi:MAG: hypothetical protein HYR97_02140 [Candidatus Melainabacteria bacterium]|nr:hypothetical protein [Candidatus Melainabacteria bacterium]MBI3308013.1 hypothetical protein [Candidatus Melainabacteria bacterium]